MILLLLLSLIPIQTQASYCERVTSIEKELLSCEDNVLFSKAAEACVVSFSKKVRNAQEDLKKKLEKTISQSNSNQNNSQETSQKTYNDMNKSLDLLIAEAVARKQEVELYRKNLVWPIIWNEEMGPIPDVDDPDLQELFDEDYCYGEYSDHLKDAKKDLDNMINDLKATQEVAKLAEQTSANRKSLLDNPVFTTPKPLLSESQASGGKTTNLPTNTRQNEENDSDISGTEEGK